MTETISQPPKPIVSTDNAESVNKEWNDLQDHANDLPEIPTPKLPKRKNLYSITGKDLGKGWGSTQAGHIGEALDED